MRLILLLVTLALTQAFVLETSRYSCLATRTTQTLLESSHQDDMDLVVTGSGSSRRTFLTTTTTAAAAAAVFGLGLGSQAQQAEAVGPVKVFLTVTNYSAKICPPDRPIPGEKAMQGMRGLCVTVDADLKELSPKDLSKVGVYGFITDAGTGDSVLANNPDLSTDAGQFAMVEQVTTSDKKIQFEFIAAVPMDRDISKFDNGIGPLDFTGIRLVSYPGGQQFGAISPCEMNEFSDECSTWEDENGPYTKAEFMVKSNSRTKGQ
jgi:hypothetical protein